MNKRIVTLLSLLPLCAFAQNMPQFDPSQMPSQADMQKMMQNAQQMQQCMAEIDQAAIDRLEQRGNEVNDRIRALCVAGDEDEALDLAVSFAEEVRGSKVVQDVQACSSEMMKMMPQMSFTQMVDMYGDAEEDLCEQVL